MTNVEIDRLREENKQLKAALADMLNFVGCEGMNEEGMKEFDRKVAKAESLLASQCDKPE